VATLPENAPAEQVANLFATMKAGYCALGQLLEQHRDYLLKIVSEEIDPGLVPRHGTSDVVQTTFLQVLENSLRTTNGLFAVEADEDVRRWLRRVCLNALKKEHRDEGRDVRDFRRDQAAPAGLDEPVGDRSPSSACRGRERDELLGQAVSSLPEADRLLLRLHYWHDWKQGALAELLDGVPSDAGRVKMGRRLASLILQLGEDDALQGLGD
jgi:RNA polymerase sigma factor (sigma-70 family)